jgi:lysophospholipase L1-like esterase
MKISIIISILYLLVYSNSTTAQDWPNLKRYATENEQLLKLENMEDRIVFMGNSITEGWKQANPDFFARENYINRGISGQTTPQMLVRFRQDVVDLNPEYVVILAGINDIAGNTGPSTIQMIADNIFSMSEIATAHDIEVILCSVLPAIDFPWNPGLKPAQKVVALNLLLKEYADKHDLTYVDYFSAMVDDDMGLKADLGYDGVHPNAKGYSIMEVIIEDAFTTLNKLKE